MSVDRVQMRSLTYRTLGCPWETEVAKARRWEPKPWTRGCSSCALHTEICQHAETLTHTLSLPPPSRSPSLYPPSLSLFTVTHSHKHLPCSLTFIITFSVSVCHALLASALKARPFPCLHSDLLEQSGTALQVKKKKNYYPLLISPS